LPSRQVLHVKSLLDYYYSHEPYRRNRVDTAIREASSSVVCGCGNRVAVCSMSCYYFAFSASSILLISSSALLNAVLTSIVPFLYSLKYFTAIPSDFDRYGEAFGYGTGLLLKILSIRLPFRTFRFLPNSAWIAVFFSGEMIP
ncbi:MAG: hypothetical protein K0Q94_6821, partial [Paenibacillus sp.]|nr:hypothetical protein [Paenibacillus sp.]